MLRHDVTHLLDVSGTLFSLYCPVLVKLSDELPLMVFVDVLDSFAFKLVLLLVLDLTIRNFACIRKPNGIVLVFVELTLHADQLNVVQF